MPAPIPFEAPVTTATFPFSFPFFIISFIFVCSRSCASGSAEVSLGRVVLCRHRATVGFFGTSGELVPATSLEVKESLVVTCPHLTFFCWLGFPLLLDHSFKGKREG